MYVCFDYMYVQRGFDATTGFKRGQQDNGMCVSVCSAFGFCRAGVRLTPGTSARLSYSELMINLELCRLLSVQYISFI
jgi:hypothetical protein